MPLTFPCHLKGLPENKYGDHQATPMRRYSGKFGAASPCYTYSEEGKAKLEAQMRCEGRI
jgi:hypothetical protein